MPHEAIVEVAADMLELGVEAATSSNNKKNGMGCLLLTIILVLISVGIYFVASNSESNETKGLITKKLPNNKMVIRTENGEDVYTINHELYLNKQEGDSIILKK
jgi:hypothetical protein